jgi:hypothetical protein
MSRNARTLSLSKSLKDGMSPKRNVVSRRPCGFAGVRTLTFDNFAENTRC